MRRIDFLGAHSVGKSTTYDELVDRRDDTPKWLTRLEAKRRLAATELLDDGTPKDFVKAATCFLPGLGDIFVETFTRHPAEEAFARDDGAYRHFVEHCVRHLAGIESPTMTTGPRPETSRHLLRAPTGRPSATPNSASSLEPIDCVNFSSMFGRLRELCLLESLDETVVFDESLAHATAGLASAASSDAAVRSYFEALPLPDALLHLRAPVDEIIDRNRNRANTGKSQLHFRTVDHVELQSKIRRSVRIAEIGACTLEWRGTRVLSLDATRPVEQNADEIETFLAG